jgi:Transcription factor WhiB
MILLDDYTLTNAEVALRARVDRGLPRRVRYELVSLGAIPPSRIVAKRGPAFKPLPRPPWALTMGSCAGHERPGLWTSDVPAERAEAIEVCSGCPVQQACLGWSLSLPSRDTAIYAGTTATQRARLRYLRAGQPEPGWMSAASRHARRDARRAAARAAREAGGAA